MKVVIKKSRGFRGEVLIPGDKSISHRAAFISSMASGSSEIINFLFAGDCLATLRCLQNIGVEFNRKKDNRITIKGKNLYGFREPEAAFNPENSGTTARFMLG